MAKGARGRFIELNDVAHILDCSPVEVVDLASKRKLTAIRKGKYSIFRISDLESYKREHTSK